MGINRDGAYFCSDVRCLSRWVDKVAVAPDNVVAVANRQSVAFYDFKGNPVSVKFFAVENAEEISGADGDYMLKEILEIPEKYVRQSRDILKAAG